jgi:hypothetical protein
MPFFKSIRLLYKEAVSTGVWYLEGSADVASTSAFSAVATGCFPNLRCYGRANMCMCACVCAGGRASVLTTLAGHELEMGDAAQQQLHACLANLPPISSPYMPIGQV